MSQRDRYPAGVPCWVETLQPQPEAAVDFYGSLFGWEFSESEPMPGGMPGEFFVARVDGRPVAGIGALPGAGGPPIAVWNTYVCVDSVEQSIDRVKAAGGQVLIGPLEGVPSGYFAVIADPAGAAISVCEATARPSAQLVNEPGARAMSSLHTTERNRLLRGRLRLAAPDRRCTRSAPYAVSARRLPRRRTRTADRARCRRRNRTAQRSQRGPNHPAALERQPPSL